MRLRRFEVVIIAIVIVQATSAWWYAEWFVATGGLLMPFFVAFLYAVVFRYGAHLLGLELASMANLFEVACRSTRAISKEAHEELVTLAKKHDEEFKR